MGCPGKGPGQPNRSRKCNIPELSLAKSRQCLRHALA